MKRGYEYLSSLEKRRVDRALLVLAQPSVKATELLVRSYINNGSIDYMSPVFNQTRVGYGRRSFLIDKFVTLHPETQESLGPIAAKLRKLGLDELAQVKNVRQGNMSFVGWRPLVPAENEAFREALPPALRARHDVVMDHSKPGIISSYGIYSHAMREEDPNEPEIRAEMNIKDVIDASPINDVRLIGGMMKYALERRLR